MVEVISSTWGHLKFKNKFKNFKNVLEVDSNVDELREVRGQIDQFVQLQRQFKKFVANFQWEFVSGPPKHLYKLFLLHKNYMEKRRSTSGPESNSRRLVGRPR